MSCGRNRLKIGPLVRYPAITSTLATALLLSGCDVGRGAPSFTLFGAFFPGWMFCAAFGILAAIGARIVLVSTGWSAVLPFQLFVCTSIGMIFGLLVWLLWFGR
jgi:hypothetical protein